MRRKITKRLISMMMAIVMLLSLFPFSAFADEVTASDLDGHWAEQVMQEWMGYGIVAGYEDGTVRPDRSITRAEMTAMLDRVMDYQTKAANPFTDLDDAWYTEVVLKANAAGVISGYPDNTVRPNATISRQEAVAMFARVLSLDTTNAPEADFTDNDAVADWAKDAVNAMAAAGYIHGSDGQFRPDAGITRAEVITIFNNIFDKLYAKAGTYTGDVNGSAVVSADGVTLENMHIKGDLIIAEGVGDGHIELDNVTVDGQLIVRGGGENSIIIKGDSQIGTISIERKDGAVRVAVENGADVSMIAVNDGSNGVKIEGNVTTLNVANIDADVTIDGTIDNLNVSGPRATVTISGSVENIAVEDNAHDATLVINKDTTVDTLKTSAENTTIVTSGDIDTVTIGTSAPGATITVESTGAIGNVTTSASGTTVEGEGSVDKVEVTENASDTTITTSGTTIENNSDEAVSIGNGDTIASGTTGTTPDGEADEPEQPSTPTPQPTPEPDPTPDPEPTTFTVTFQNTDSTTIATQTVTENGTASAPTEGLPTVEEGQKLTWYNGTEPFDFSAAITSNLILVAVVGSDDFTAGNGSESYPYLISTAQELANIDNLSSQMQSKQGYNFVLTNDIDYTTTTSYINYFCGTLDGNGHSIQMSESSDNALIATTSGNVTIKNLTIVQTSKVLAMLTVYANGDTGDVITYENITFTSGAPADTQHVACSYGASQFGMQTSGTVNFINCVNEVNYTIPADSAGYGGLFIGNYIPNSAPSMISFINCGNTGNINGTQIGFFFGNSAQASGGITLVDNSSYVNSDSDHAAIYVSGCYNSGTILATQKCEPFISLGTSTVNDSANTQLLADNNKFQQTGTMSTSSVNDMGLQLDANNQIKITPSSNSNISNYLIKYTVSTSYQDADGTSLGSWYFSVSETIASSEVESKTFDFIQKVMLDTEYDATVSDENKKYANLAAQEGAEKTDVNGNEYIIVTLEDGTKAAVIDSKQAAQHFEDTASTIHCGTTPTYTLVAINNDNQYLGSINYQMSSIPRADQDSVIEG